MNPITHALTGWCLAEAVPRLDRREKAIVTLAAMTPDLDGVGAIAEVATRDTGHPLLWWSEYHHLLAHNLLFAVIVGVVSAALARSRLVTGTLAFVAVHIHLLCDLAGSRGPDGYEWPIPYLYPFSMWPQLAWSGQWRLNAWPNFVITAILLLLTFVLAWRRGYSPVGLLSPGADRAFVGALRDRFGTPQAG